MWTELLYYREWEHLVTMGNAKIEEISIDTFMRRVISK